MRTHGFRTHVLLVIAGAVAVLASLSRPWYARAPKPVPADALGIGDVNGPLYGLQHGIGRWLSGASGQTGWHALGTLGQVLAALAAFSAVAALGCMVAGVQGLVSQLLRYASMTTLAVVAWRVVDPPRANDVWELRNGALIGLGGALMLAVSAQAVASAPSRRRVVTPRYVAPPPPPAYGSAGPPP